ncbi:rhodanese-like domain-containing protein [Desulfuromonas acetoxidans]|uniref:Rhodanese-like n=1 Tax=Desulfuromonas acetoxidans (strain DSM 684 / 11070) TaxID=281689 RepID=Q1K257_DESA6|nr:rhodanese-like domain-containing protein [Desulfuromonas acetoxidans]EAT16582.1 Rhodanese-like [Desulfuromonas acetoxidans DSM 684]MBF0644453.1 rhodanese-like domain-containing protein [Desulfuromonas acetoxidans]NVD24693.1 rhodanese-like domain-containing protein [Desulfuromonas acetoxidans]NVE16738.1 rhodanese-like domain-containing protein [Desulfuromonas acetoxidans]
MELSMNWRRPLFGGAAILLLAIAACGENVAPKSLNQQLKKKNRPVVVDVRSSFEYQSGHVPGAIHIPLWSVPFSRSKLPKELDGIVIYCEHGPRAVLARGLFLLIGVRPVAFVKGHMAAWRQARLPMEK